MDVVALISGGKDSFLALLHAIRLGHRIVALANLHPPLSTTADESTTAYQPHGAMALDASALGGIEELDSFMYQTVGSHLLPLYATALRLPLYRRAIKGTSVQQSLEYGAGSQDRDETEDLLRLLQDVMHQHPTTKAVSAGAILSTYQRTRIESVCGRLGLTSLAYLWQRDQTSIIQEMISVGLDARIVKVAALGLDDAWLWQNVATNHCLNRLKRLEEKWGVNVAGEGGEFETIVVEGPGWEGRIVVDNDERVQCADGGAYWVSIRGGRIVPRQSRGGQSEWARGLTSADMWEPEFKDALDRLAPQESISVDEPHQAAATADFLPPKISLSKDGSGQIVWINNISASQHSSDIASEAHAIFSLLASHVPDFSRRVASTLLLLRSMEDFCIVNVTYSIYFPHPLPPSRVCVSPSAMPAGVNILLSTSLCGAIDSPRKGLHVQSRSHWAPANIGPYSQAIHASGWIEIAGMIPLVPGSMEPVNHGTTHADLTGQSLLAIQHIHRVLDVVGSRDALLGGCAWVTSAAAAAAAVQTWGEACTDKPCLVVMAQALPRGVGVEWVGYAAEESEDAKRIDVLLTDCAGADWISSLVSLAKDGLTTVYTGRTEHFVEAWERASGNGVRVVPTTCVWDSNGRKWETAAVVRW